VLRNIFFFQDRKYNYYDLYNLNENCAIIDANGCFHFNHTVKDNKLKQVALKYPWLRSINLSFCTEITYTGLEELEKGCTNLQTLNLMYCKNITNDCFKGKEWKNLQTLNLSGCTEITNDCFKGKEWKNLQTLNLSGCKKITDAGLMVLAKGCTNLQTLDLSDCTEITYTGLEVLVKECQNLQYLYLFACDRITDQYKKYLEKIKQDKLEIDFLK
jgi:F-box/leucine-rich repeat protein 2/20